MAITAEGLEKGYLLFREGTNLLTPNHNGPYRYPLSRQWRCKRSSSARNLLKDASIRELSFDRCGHVMDVDGLLVDHGAAPWKAATDYSGSSTCNWSKSRRRLKGVASDAKDQSV
jgi:hypothetical protein